MSPRPLFRGEFGGQLGIRVLDSGKKHLVGMGGGTVQESSPVCDWELKSQKRVKLPSGIKMQKR